MRSSGARFFMTAIALMLWAYPSAAQAWNSTELELPSGYVIVANEQTVDMLTPHRVLVLHSNTQTGLIDAYAIDDERMLFRTKSDVGSEIYLVVPPARQAEAQAGLSPTSSRSTHILHFSTWPFTGSSCGALYGHTQVQ